MAKHFDADAARGLHDPISFTVNGKKYEVRELTDELQAEIEATAQESATLENTLRKQLGIFTEHDPAEFSGVSARVMTAIIQHIQDATLDPLGRRDGGRRR